MRSEHFNRPPSSCNCNGLLHELPSRRSIDNIVGEIHNFFGESTMTAQTTAAAAEVPPPIAMLQLISGFWISRCIYVAAKLGISDLVKDGSKTAAELAAATGTDAPSLFRLMRALASVGVFSQDAD